MLLLNKKFVINHLAVLRGLRLVVTLFIVCMSLPDFTSSPKIYVFEATCSQYISLKEAYPTKDFLKGPISYICVEQPSVRGLSFFPYLLF